jgi:protein-S-isoprenylcysteine O-methyltransferase Ste14
MCHGTFFAAVSTMFTGLWSGLAIGRGPFEGTSASFANLALALQFPIGHSAFLTRRGRSFLSRLFGARFGRDLAPTAYACIASIQLLATFALWSPSHEVWWEPSGRFGIVMNVVNGAAWVILGKALLDGGLGLQTGWIGWTAVWRGRRVEYPPLQQRGLFAVCRQPIYLAFALTLWSAPNWTPDRLLLATVWSAYCLVGPLHKERRYLKSYGADFASYRKQVPYMFPFRRRAA